MLCGHRQIDCVVRKVDFADMNEPAKPERLRFQFKLRTLLVAVLLLSLPLSWVAVGMERARKQREAVEAIVKLGGGVRYDYHDGVCDPAEHPPVPSWLLKLFEPR